MQVIVIGCGLAGVTTAYFLRQQGADVTVIDRAPAPARETSFANGSMITPSLADPWNAPGVLSQLIRSLGNEDASMLLRPAALPTLVGWGLRFLRHSTEKRFLNSFLSNVRFARYSQEAMQLLLQAAPLDFEYAPDGILKVFSNAAALQRGREVASWLRQAGVEHEVLDPQGLLAREPALEPVIGRFAGAIHYPQDEVGNARLFCEALQRRAATEGIRFRFSEQVRTVERSGGRLISVTTARERLTADQFVLAAGSFSWPLGKQFGINVPVRPAKGYSLTKRIDEVAVKPKYAVVDEALHAAVVPLGGDRLRVAGTAEFAGFDTSVRPERINNLERLLEQIYPEIAGRPGKVEAWAGLRPMTTDGKPLVGVSKVDNLFLNTGHGPLGWTLACGSGRALAELMTAGSTEFDLTPFRPDRF